MLRITLVQIFAPHTPTWRFVYTHLHSWTSGYKGNETKNKRKEEDQQSAAML